MKSVVLYLIDFYRRWLSFDGGLFSTFAPGGACKQNPSCSLYTKQMVQKYGVFQGLILGGRRILSCR